MTHDGALYSCRAKPRVEPMAMSGISAAASQSAGQPGIHSLAQHKHGGHRSHSLSDIDAQGSSVASAPSPTGKVGGKLDISA